MTQLPEFWALIAVSVLVLLLGGAMTLLSYLAYRREDRRSLWVAGFGFGLVTTAGLITVIYQLFVQRSYFVPNRELLVLHVIQGITLVLGLLALVYSITKH